LVGEFAWKQGHNGRAQGAEYRNIECHPSSAGRAIDSAPAFTDAPPYPLYTSRNAICTCHMPSRHVNAAGMKRILLSLLALLPFYGALADENPAVTPADRNQEQGWASRHAVKFGDPKRKEANVIFFGDSITQGWEGKGKEVWEKSIEPLGAFNLGFSGDRTEHALWRIDNGEFDETKPKVIVILLGTNNIGHKKSNPQQTAEGMKAILERLSKKTPEAKVLLLGVFPRAAKADEPLRQQAAEITKLYSGLADGKKVVFLDIGAKFLEADGTMSKEVMPDFLHPSEKGYQIWADAMLPTLQEMLK
jgi:lysophospholipase L1-like esterase